MIKINVIVNNVNWFRFIKKPENYIDRKVKKLNLHNKDFKKNIVFCTLLLSGNKEIRDLNKRFRKKDKPTDVLSFPFYNKKNVKNILRKEKEIYIGDIIINLNKISTKENLTFFESQFDKLWIHGLVHLFGHTHKQEKNFKKMHRIETAYLKNII